MHNDLQDIAGSLSMDADRSVDLGKQAEAATSGQEVVDPIAALDQGFVLPSASSATEAARSRMKAAVERLSFRVGDLGLLCPRDAGREVTQPPAISRIPNTAPWLKGLANVRGELVPVVDLAAALGVGRDETADLYLLIFGHGEESMGLLIDGLPKGRTLRAEEQLAGPPPVPELLRERVTAAYDHDDRVWLELDLQRFFEALGEGAGT